MRERLNLYMLCGAVLVCVLSRTAQGLDAGEARFLEEINKEWNVCGDPNNSSTCTGLVCDSQDHIIGMFVPFHMPTFGWHLNMLCGGAEWCGYISFFPSML